MGSNNYSELTDYQLYPTLRYTGGLWYNNGVVIPNDINVSDINLLEYND